MGHKCRWIDAHGIPGGRIVEREVLGVPALDEHSSKGAFPDLAGALNDDGRKDIEGVTSEGQQVPVDES